MEQLQSAQPVTSNSTPPQPETTSSQQNVTSSEQNVTSSEYEQVIAERNSLISSIEEIRRNQVRPVFNVNLISLNVPSEVR